MTDDQKIDAHFDPPDDGFICGECEKHVNADPEENRCGDCEQYVCEDCIDAHLCGDDDDDWNWCGDE